MRVWTRGAEHVALTDQGTFIFRPNEAPRRHPSPRAGRHPGSGDILAVTPSGAAAWTDGLARVSLADGAIDRPARPVRVEDVAALDETRVAAVLGSATKKTPPVLALGDPRAAKWQERLELNARAAPRSEAFSRVLWADGTTPPWFRATAFGPGLVDGHRITRLCASEHGIAVAGSRSGLVGVLRPGADRLSCVIRVPARDEVTVDAVATAKGVLVTLVIPGRHAAVAHFNERGRCTGITGRLLGSVGAVVVGDRVLAFDEGTSERLVRIFRLPDLAELKSGMPCPIGVAPTDAHASRDGKTAVFGAGSEVVVVEVSAKGLQVIERHVGTSSPEEQERDAVPAVAEVRPRTKRRFTRCEGQPALGFAVMKAAPAPWSGQTGSPLEIVMSVRSTGGPGTGVRLELSGPALDEGLIVPERVAFGEQGADFAPDAKGGAAAALLPDATIPSGIVYPFDPKPTTPEALAEATALLAATHIEVRLALRAARAGSALLSVSMRPSTGTSAPMKWTRPMTVEG